MVLCVLQRFHIRYLTIVLTSGGTLQRILSSSAGSFGHAFRESCPNIPSRTEGDRPRKKDGHDFFNHRSSIRAQGENQAQSHNDDVAFIALPCFPLLDHALNSALPYLALHCFTFLGLPLPCAPCIALLCFAVRCLGLQCSTLLCFAWQPFALLCPRGPASTHTCNPERLHSLFS